MTKEAIFILFLIAFSITLGNIFLNPNPVLKIFLSLPLGFTTGILWSMWQHKKTIENEQDK